MSGGEDGSAVVRRVVRVSGVVQGVWFRDATRRKAERLGVAGVARNLSDGSVEVVLEGRRDAVAEVEAWCAVGPVHARVTGVETRDEPPVGLSDFLVR